VGANFAIALADPVGPPGEIAETISGFRRFCEDQGWGVAFYQTLPDFLPIYRSPGFKRLKIGDDAIVDLKGFTLEGGPRKRLRSRIKQLDKAGVQMRYYPVPVPDELLKQLREISDEWLRLLGRREREFSLGRFDRAYLRSTPVATVENAGGSALAFVNIVPSYHPGEATIDLMRHRPDAPNGVMDFLFVKLLLRARDEGYTRFNFGLSPMSGFQEREEASAMERTVYQFFQRLTFLFSFSGLKAYKAKFASCWELRYVIYRHALDLPKVGVALGKVSNLK
jgi:phosphatidylglycerol lysyltransferase